MILLSILAVAAVCALAVGVRRLSIFFEMRRVPWFGRLERARQLYGAIDQPTWRVAIENRRFVVTSGDSRFRYPSGLDAWFEAAALSEAIRRHNEGHVSLETRYRNVDQEESWIRSERMRVETLQREEAIRLEKATREFEMELTRTGEIR